MIHKRIVAAAVAIPVVAFGVTAVTPTQEAAATNSHVENVSDGFRVATRDNCWKVVIQPGVTVNMSCGDRQVWVNAGHCVSIKRVGIGWKKYCSLGSKGYWQSYGWSVHTKLWRTNT
jgi:gamma-glutamyl-gamma-aminobutyrate hydrolase PuuD